MVRRQTHFERPLSLGRFGPLGFGGYDGGLCKFAGFGAVPEPLDLLGAQVILAVNV